MAIFFLAIFAVLSVSFLSVTNVSKRGSENNRAMASAQIAAENGLQFFSHLAKTWPAPSTCYTHKNYVTDSEAIIAFTSFAGYVQNAVPQNRLASGSNITFNSGTNELLIPGVTLGNAPMSFTVRCQLSMPVSAGEYHKVIVTSTGNSEDISRDVQIEFDLCKSAKVLEYAIASRGRIWLTGDSTIHGDVFSSWDNIACAPFNMTSESTVEGTINTIFTKNQAQSSSWQLETLDSDGNVVYDEDGNPVVSANDQIQGSHYGINYGVASEVPGMNISDYDTSTYESSVTNIANTYETRTEYFPHAAGNYSAAASSSSRKVTRKVYRDQHFTNAKIPYNYNALFINCTFDETLFVDCSKTTSSYYNNIRFDNCTFNGPIVTDTPSSLNWQANCLYFTGSATFNNDSMSEATILAPHFNVNLGNTVPISGNANVLTGAIVGGIVDIRGNANVYGTIISMCDTTNWTSGYVTNIGVSLTDGGSESVEEGDIGVIDITPDKNNMLPSGISTPIVIKPNANTYVEI